MKTLILMCSLALVTGCATNTRVETVEVSVPVPVPCVDPDDVPAEVPRAEESLSKDSPPGEKIQAILVEREGLRAANTKFRAAVQGCLLTGEQP